MNLSDALHHVLNLTLSWLRIEKHHFSRQDWQEMPLDGRGSISAPLGHISYRRLNTQAHLEDGIARARTRRYATTKCHSPKGEKGKTGDS